MIKTSRLNAEILSDNYAKSGQLRGGEEPMLIKIYDFQLRNKTTERQTLTADKNQCRQNNTGPWRENAVLLSAGRLGVQQHVVWERDDGTVVAGTNDR